MSTLIEMQIFYFVYEIILFAAGNNQAKQVSSIDKKLFIRGQHASMINGLQSRYPIYGPVVR